MSKRAPAHATLVLAALACLVALPVRAQLAAPALQPVVLATYPHDPLAFTQGLQLHDGALYESTGLYGRSSLRQVEVATGNVLRKVDLPADRFGEGLAWANDTLVQLTWKEGVALVYDPATFQKVKELAYTGEGWGLCFDGAQLIQTDGSHQLTFRDPTTFAVTKQLPVILDGQPVTALNELECVGEHVYANIWMTDRIVEIAKQSGAVTGVIDAHNLLTREERTRIGPNAILNGIAYDASNNTFLLTGKLWPKLFRVRFAPTPP